MNRLLATLAALSLLFVVTGCGQSGPLYIPGNPSTIQNPPPPDQQAEEEEEKEDDGN